MGVPRQQELRKRRTRQNKLRKLRRLYQAARGQDQRTEIVQKAGRVSPGLSVETFLAPLSRGSA